MKNLRAYPAAILLLLFSCYYCGISLFSHAHIMNGSSIAHSHFGGSDAGIQNILNSFQRDFDSGADRDSGYMYGPTLPRCFYLGIKLNY